jgi:hypothetical protein
LYPDFFDLVVEGEILQVDLDQKTFISFPALFCCCWKSFEYFQEIFVSKTRRGKRLFTAADFFAAERKYHIDICF